LTAFTDCRAGGVALRLVAAVDAFVGAAFLTATLAAMRRAAVFLAAALRAASLRAAAALSAAAFFAFKEAAFVLAEVVFAFAEAFPRAALDLEAWARCDFAAEAGFAVDFADFPRDLAAAAFLDFAGFFFEAIRGALLFPAKPANTHVRSEPDPRARTLQRVRRRLFAECL